MNIIDYGWRQNQTHLIGPVIVNNWPVMAYVEGPEEGIWPPDENGIHSTRLKLGGDEFYVYNPFLTPRR